MEAGVHTEVRDGAVIVRVLGDVDMDTAPLLSAALEPLFTSTPRVIVDLESVTFIDSSGLGVFVAAQQQASAGQLVLAGASPRIRHLLELTGLDQVFTLVSDVEEALDQ